TCRPDPFQARATYSQYSQYSQNLDAKADLAVGFCEYCEYCEWQMEIRWFMGYYCPGFCEYCESQPKGRDPIVGALLLVGRRVGWTCFEVCGRAVTFILHNERVEMLDVGNRADDGTCECDLRRSARKPRFDSFSYCAACPICTKM